VRQLRPAVVSLGREVRAAPAGRVSRSASGALGETVDHSYGMVLRKCIAADAARISVMFNDGPPPTGLRYCINGVAPIFSD
jgi:peptide methionine sulfoxide reductase MsrB